MNESSCQFGADRHLAGILTDPSSSSTTKKKTTTTKKRGIVLVSAGLVPKDGPFRLYAELARRLSRMGFSTLRFDLGGIGDSQRSHSTNSHPLRERTALEIRTAVDCLVEHMGRGSSGDIAMTDNNRPTSDIDLFVGGLCSGAEDSFRFAETDRRVTGVVMIDPFAYRTKGWMWRHTVQRAARRCARALGIYEPFPTQASPIHTNTSLVSYAYMSQPESTRILTSLLRRRVRTHFLYTGGVEQAFKHKRQLCAMFDGIDFESSDVCDLVTLDRFPSLGHTQMLAKQREAIVETIARRLSIHA